MKVFELIKILEKFPSDMEVEVMCGYDDHCSTGGLLEGVYVADYSKLYEDCNYVNSTDMPKRLVLHDGTVCLSEKEKSCYDPLLV